MPSEQVRLELTPAPATITSFDPFSRDGTSPRQRWQGVTSLELSLSDHAIVLELEL